MELATLVSSAAVLVAVTIGAMQIRQMVKTRALFTASELVRTVQTVEFARSVRVVLALPIDADPESIESDPERLTAVLAVTHFYESIGVLVFHRVLPLHLVDHLLGGYVRQCWPRVARHTEARRTALGVYYGEWAQWLAERLVEHPAPGKAIGAHLAHRRWRP